MGRGRQEQPAQRRGRDPLLSIGQSNRAGWTGLQRAWYPADSDTATRRGERMSALVMVLVAGMGLGSGPENGSGKMLQVLDLSGEWEGTLKDSEGRVRTV